MTHRPTTGGHVYIVGAGPGPADLLTRRAQRALDAADVVLADYLLDDSLIRDIQSRPQPPLLIHLRESRDRLTQDAINDLLVFHARQGRTVVRLKSGDPFVYGRGQEEAEHLEAAGISWEVVPGLSSGASLGLASLPLTQRGAGRSFAFVTARLRDGEINEAFPVADSLVIFMGHAALPAIAARLRADGWPTNTPVALLERLAQPWERRAFTTLALAADIAAAQGLQSPLLIVVGAAARRGEAYQNRPTLLFTGLDPERFRGLGELLHWPAQLDAPNALDARLIPGVLRTLRANLYDTLLFTSKQAVASFLRALQAHQLDARALGGLRLIADSESTADALAHHGLRPDHVAEGGTDSLLQTLAEAGSRRALVAEGSHAPGGLYARLQAAGIAHDRLRLHSLQPHPELGAPLPEHDAVYFVSPEAVRIFHRLYGAAMFEKPAWCLGPAVLETVRRLGGHGRIVQAHESKIPSLTLKAV